MASACEFVHIDVSRSKVREWLRELESYNLIKVN
jgi:DNA-binding GntR family transcriptional regulator